jgi:hypothetical protein
MLYFFFSLRQLQCFCHNSSFLPLFLLTLVLCVSLYLTSVGQLVIGISLLLTTVSEPSIFLRGVLPRGIIQCYITFFFEFQLVVCAQCSNCCFCCWELKCVRLCSQGISCSAPSKYKFFSGSPSSLTYYVMRSKKLYKF